MSEEIKVVQEYPKYIQLENGYKIVDSKEEEDALIKPIKEEKNEQTSKDNSQGTNKKKSNTGGGVGAGRESN